MTVVYGMAAESGRECHALRTGYQVEVVRLRHENFASAVPKIQAQLFFSFGVSPGQGDSLKLTFWPGLVACY